jgi:hypothetical protein
MAQVADPLAALAAPPSHWKDSGSTKPGQGKGGKTTNTAPTISGAPADSVVEGTQYRFQPEANDADGDALVFSVLNLPFWATFNPLTGELAGTPSAADVGTYTNILVEVTDGQAVAQLPAFSIEVLAYGFGSATLTWSPPTENVDGSPLQDLAGYQLYWGQASRSYSQSVEIPNPGITTYIVENLLSGGTYYFAAKAINASGVQSDFSAEVTAVAH